MTRQLVIPLVCFLFPGCAFDHRPPMYSDYERIELGVPPPADIQGDSQWGTKQRTEWRWSTGIEEQARYRLGANGEVIAKWYRGRGEEGSLPMLWYKRRDRSEGEMLIPAGQVTSDAGVLDAIRNAYNQLWHEGMEQNVCEVLRLAEHKGGLTNAKFRFRQTQTETLFPFIEATVLQLRRKDSNIFHVFVEERKDISLVVWALFGWTSKLAGEFP